MDVTSRRFARLSGLRWLWWRMLVLALVIGLGLVALEAGVELSERPGIGRAPLPARLYYLLGLFVFGGLDLGVPSGGPPWARDLLWLVYFAAPAITTTALIEGLLLILSPQAWRLRRLRGHVVIGGCGRLALRYLDRLRQTSPKTPVLVVERRAENPHARVIAERPRTEVLYGDVASDAVLQSLGLERALSVILLTGDDHANLDAASRICRIRPQLARRTLVHVSDIRLLRVLEHGGILDQVAKFNGYRSAARHLVANTLLPHFHLTERADAVVLAGFGRFGQTVLDELQRAAGGQFQVVVVIDLEAEQRAQVFDEQLGFDRGYRHHVLQADLRHPGTWKRVRELLGEIQTRPVFVLGSGDDGVNIRTALGLSHRMPESKIVARCFDQTSFTRQISEQCGFEIVSTSELLLDSMGEWLAGAPGSTRR